MTLGQNIKKLRSEKGLTQKDLADQLHVTFQTVSKWENDENEPDIAILKELAKIFGCSIDSILDYGTEHIDVVEEEGVKNEPRKAFVSEFEFDANTSAYAYSFEIIDRVYTYSERRYKQSSDEHKKEVKEKGYSFSWQVMEDVLADFFIDEKDMTIGFYYDHAEHFVCPIENIVDIDVDESGQSFGYQRVNSYIIKIKYTSDDKINTYSITFFAYSQAAKEKWKKEGASTLVKETDSEQWTTSSMEIIKGKLEHLKELAEDIKSGKIHVEQFDFHEKMIASSNGQQSIDYDQKLAKSYRRKEMTHIPSKPTTSSSSSSTTHTSSSYYTSRPRYSDDEGSIGGGFALGFLLGLIGLIIGLCSKKSKTKTGSIIGFIVQDIIGIILAISITASLGK